MIEWRWGLDPLTVRDETANNLAEALDFTQPRTTQAPQFSVPAGPFGAPCASTPTAAASSEPDLASLATLGAALGWPIGNVSPSTIASLLQQLGAAN